ncbi:glucosaminidase domain-containing protein [Caryophanon latum]|uniref:Uncharacterized protein n=1 Tax=Caryophanon latum TaxID=33977 RepID=A0A1C0YRB2_9BACL|nr:glucosaminidase domain-containing protein [Caryophanon latum]OCS89690.1 hypothetical protein A6K76_12245 [Caryophanon latum]
MKKVQAMIIFCAMLLAIIMPHRASADVPYTLKMSSDYTWTVTFSENVKSSVINRSNIYIGDENGKKLSGYTYSFVTIKGKVVTVKPPKAGYEEGKTYTLVITNRLVKTSGESFNVNVAEKFLTGPAATKPTDKPTDKPAVTAPTPQPTEKPSITSDAYTAKLNDDNTWTLQLNEAPKKTVINRSNFYIADQNGKKLSGYTFSRVTVSGKTVTLQPPLSGYEDGKTYQLVMTERAETSTGNRYGFNIAQSFTIGEAAVEETPKPTPAPPVVEQPKPEQPKPTIPAPTSNYSVVNILSNGSYKVHSTYSTFAEAKKRVGNNQGIVKNGQLVAMKSGFIQTKAANGNVLTRVFNDANLTSERTYLPANSEIAYVDATERSIKVNVAGQEGYIAHDNAVLKPFNAYFTRNYYANVNGELAHYIYAPSKNSYDSYTISAAPKFMVRGVKYYSLDGATFTDATGKVIGTSYPYYQVASVRSQTKFTAAQIDRYIQEILKTRGSSAVQKSKIKNLGATLIALQNKYNINALAILSMAQHESAYGMSDHALKHNNLFGLNVTDNGNPADTYPSVANNIETLVIQYLEKKYLPPTAWFPNGTVFGNKDYGMNVKYASDPYWGSKIAGHYYRMMKMMATLGYGQDKRYQVARLKDNTVQTYRYSGLTQAAFTYNGNAKGKFVLILEEGANFYKISSDTSAYKAVYVRKNVLEKVATH